MGKAKLKIRDGVLVSVEDNGSKVIEVPDTVKAIGNDAFGCCFSVEEVILPDTIESIGFHGLGYIDKVNIPSSVTKMSTGMFKHTPKRVTCDEGSYLVRKITHQGYELPLPYISAWPRPIDLENYRKIFEERPEIKRIFVYSSVDWLTALSVEGFLAAIDEICVTKKLYICEFQFNGNTMNPDGYYQFGTVRPADIIVQNGHYQGVKYHWIRIGSDRDGWPSSDHADRMIRPTDKVRVNFDAGEYGDLTGTIELLENVRDSRNYRDDSSSAQDCVKLHEKYLQDKSNHMITGSFMTSVEEKEKELKEKELKAKEELVECEKKYSKIERIRSIVMGSDKTKKSNKSPKYF